MNNRALSILGFFCLLLIGCGYGFDNNLIVGREQSNTQVRTAGGGGDSYSVEIPDDVNNADGNPDAANSSNGSGGTSNITQYTSDGAVQIGTAPYQCQRRAVSQIFRYALCSCSDTNIFGTLTTDAFDSNKGPFMAESVTTGAAVGVNGTLNCATDINIGGSLIVAGEFGLTSLGTVRVAGDLRVQGPFTHSPQFEVLNNCWLASGSIGLGNLHIAGNLIMPEASPADFLLSSMTIIDGETLRQPVTVQPPCECGDKEIVNVAQIIANNKADNEKTVFFADIYSVSPGGRFELPARAFVTSVSNISVNQQLTLVVNQKTTLFVEGDVSSVGALNLEMGPQGELDMYIGGNLTLAGGTVLGDPNRPSKLRVYVAGNQLISLAGNNLFAGNLYAPRATVMMAGAQTFYGALFANTVQTAVQTIIHYDSAIIREGDDCHTPARCDDCTDCEATSGCVDGYCGACRADADCCEPLVCMNGRCGVLLL